ncbi:MAG: hypothetical protein RLZZ282_925, partial [Verrucomicrobiota bacterium]
MTASMTHQFPTRAGTPLASVTSVAGAMRQALGRFPLPLSLVLLCCMMNSLLADTFGNFTYTDDGNSITIIKYSADAGGVVDIPAIIIGKPVTIIGNSAFQSCTGLTGVTVPVSVTTIGSNAFDGCTGLTSMSFSSPSSVISI